MKVKDILDKKGSKVVSIKDTETLGRAVELLASHNIGALVVLNEKDLSVGIISERDIVRDVYKNPNDTGTRVVKDVMTHRLLIASPDDDLEYAMGIMTNNHIRHLPVFSDEKVIGMISIGDLVKAKLKSLKYENKYLKEYMFGGR